MAPLVAAIDGCEPVQVPWSHCSEELVRVRPRRWTQLPRRGGSQGSDRVHLAELYLRCRCPPGQGGRRLIGSPIWIALLAHVHPPVSRLPSSNGVVDPARAGA